MTSVTHKTFNGPVGPILHPVLSVWVPSVFLPVMKKRHNPEPYLLCEALLVAKTPAFPVPSFFHLFQISRPPCTEGGHTCTGAVLTSKKSGSPTGRILRMAFCFFGKKGYYESSVPAGCLPPPSCFEHRLDVWSCNSHLAILRHK